MNTSLPPPEPDRVAILGALEALFEPTDVIELRAFHKGKKRTDAGYFDFEHREALADAAIRLNAQGAAVYVTLNRIDPQLMGRYCNRVENYATATVTDANVTRRRWLLIDLDPVRPKDTSATDEQLATAKEQAKACYQALKAKGWPEPLAGESGNGWHLLYPLDLPNNTAGRDLVKGALAGLAQQFDTESVKVDQSVFNAGRITKLYGTVATKGDHTPLAPWRVSRLALTPGREAVVSTEQLEALNLVNAETVRSLRTRPQQGGFNLPDFIARLGISYEVDQHEGSDRYKLAHCPFNPEHGKGEAAIFQRAGGALGFKCQHNSCADKGWQDLRTLVDGPRESRERGPKGASPQAVGIGDYNWPEPKPIRAELHPVPAFDPDTLLPDALRDWVMDEADRMPCPPDFVAAGALVVLGAIVGAKCTIKPKSRDDWLVVPNLWGGIVGLPSAKKSPAIGAALKPYDRLIATAMETHQAEIEAFEAEEMVFEAKKDAIGSRIKAAAKDAKKGDINSIAKELQEHRQQGPEQPVLRRYKSNDTTIEKLGELLRENPAGLLIMRDELVGLVASWEREGREGDRAFYLEAWNGNASFDTDRIGRGSIFIPNLCVSIFGGIQPDKLTGYLEQAAKALANDGMLQRFQVLVYPDHRTWEWRDRIPKKDARNRAFRVFEALADFNPETWGADPADDFAKFPHFRFNDAAQEIFIEWSADLHLVRLSAEDHPIIAQHLSKFDKLFPAIALVLHLVDCAATGQYGPVRADAALRAAAWCDYLEAHARRCYGLLIDEGFRAAQALADKVRQGRLQNGFTARDVRRNQWRNLTNDDAVQAALDWLEDDDWLRAKEVGGTGPGSGRRTQRYFINPMIAKAGKQGGKHG